MMDETKEKERTGPGVSDPQGPASAGGIVPAPSSSSSDVGPPLVSQESTRGEDTISSLLGRGLRRHLSANERQDVGRSSPPADPERGPDPDQPGPSGVRAAARDFEFRKPGPLSSKKKKKACIAESSEEESSDGMSVDGGGDMTPLSDVSSDTNYALTHEGHTKRSRGRPPTTGEHVGSKALKDKIKFLEKELTEVQAERDVLAGRFEVSFGATAGGASSAADVEEQLAGETVNSLVSIIVDNMEAVERVADRSGSLKGTFKYMLRHASRNAVAASRLLFSRAFTHAESNREAGALDKARCELLAARQLVEESQNRIRKLEGAIEILKARETIRASRAERSPTPPRRISAVLSDSCGEHMEVEDLPGEPPPRVDPPTQGPPTIEASSVDPSTPLENIERMVERVLGRMLPTVLEAIARPPAPSRLYSEVVGSKAKKDAAPAAPTKDASSSSFPPVQGEKGRKKKKSKKKKGPTVNPDPPGGQPPPPKGDAVKRKPQAKKRKSPVGVVREPRTAAVLVTIAPDSGITSGEMLRKSRALISVYPEMETARLKKTQAGGTLLQFAGAEGHRVADRVASAMRQIAEEARGVRVTRPMKRAELRLRGLDDSVTKEEMVDAVAGMAGCRAGDLSVGEISRLPNRLGSVWLRCPVAVSNKILEEGMPRVGLVRPVAVPLPARPMRCFRCLEVGHGVALCKGMDRSGRCHRCGDRSHEARACSAARPKCPLCADFGLPAEHSLGATACVASERVARRRKAKIKAKARETLSSKEDRPPAESGDGSRRGPHGAKPSKTIAPAGPAEGGGDTQEGPPLAPPEKGSTEVVGGRTTRSSVKRTVSERSPPAQRGQELAEGPQAESPSAPPAPPKKRRDRRERFKTR
ncbi:uncharacterized protein LOC112638027 [Camponotus floridanus]|uniref:uncharacterized protein LOC112638027 n=1 Tax=Camponotus floridanus TaxID=104421 RepID=UPI000DC66BC3|nr:uncharacterized protein LOC112638027 [Camponotus floridanus]